MGAAHSGVHPSPRLSQARGQTVTARVWLLLHSFSSMRTLRLYWLRSTTTATLNCGPVYHWLRSLLSANSSRGAHNVFNASGIAATLKALGTWPLTRCARVLVISLRLITG